MIERIGSYIRKINGDNLSNIYGEDIRGVPPNIIDIIRNFLKFLCEQDNDYITGLLQNYR